MQPKGLSRVVSSTTVQKHHINEEVRISGRGEAGHKRSKNHPGPTFSAPSLTSLPSPGPGGLHHLEEEGESLSLPAFPAPSPGVHSDWPCFGHVFTSEPIPVAGEMEHTDWLNLNHRLQSSVPAPEEKWERVDGCLGKRRASLYSIGLRFRFCGCLVM